MIVEFDKDGYPMMVMKEEEATVKITFSEMPQNLHLKDTILEMLSSVQEYNIINGSARSHI